MHVDGVARNEPESQGHPDHAAGLGVPVAHRAAEPDVRPAGRRCRTARALADEYAALVGLKGFENNYPHELSGGMLKRAEIARALVVKPEILYMDEPFSALDALMSLRMQNELLRILAKETHTVMLITHDVEEAIHLADRILVLSPAPGAHPGVVRRAVRASAARVEPRGAGAARRDPQGAGRHRNGVSGWLPAPADGGAAWRRVLPG